MILLQENSANLQLMELPKFLMRQVIRQQIGQHDPTVYTTCSAKTVKRVIIERAGKM